LEESSRRDDGPRVGVVATGHVVERAVRLDVPERNTGTFRQGLYGAHLVDTIGIDFLLGPGHFLAAEMLPIGKAGMRPYVNAMLGSEAEGGVGRRRVAGVEAAGDARR